MAKKLAVRTHVARDLLQSAAMFKTDKLVVWEYVSNGLQYRDANTTAVVNVTLDSRNKEIIVDDNGRGMDRQGLENFFIMHGENTDRKAGRPGRGRFGTGKVAAFGIADVLRVSSVKNGLRNTVELSRADIEAAGTGDITVKTRELDLSTSEPNGTVITISGIRLKKLDQGAVIAFIERHLAHWANKPTVLVNNHPCEYMDPPVSSTRRAKPSAAQRQTIGDVELILNVAKSPLEPEMQGVGIHANGVWLETTLAGASGQPMAQYIFGAIDVPLLDDESAAIPAFDMSRSMQLNRSNEVVQGVLAFVGYEVDQLRRELAREEKVRRAQEEAKRLSREANVIAEMINRDFHAFSDRVARLRARGGTGHDLARRDGSDHHELRDELVAGGNTAASEARAAPAGARNDAAPERGSSTCDRAPMLRKDDEGALLGRPSKGDGQHVGPRGGFTVEFREMGQENPRASYVSAERAIYINLDHPQIRAAKGSNQTDDLFFRRLAYEIAFSEYAIALAIEMDNNGEFIEPSDAVVEIRGTLNRMARRAADLYAA